MKEFADKEILLKKSLGTPGVLCSNPIDNENLSWFWSDFGFGQKTTM